MPARIIVVHDEAEFRCQLTTSLQSAGYFVACHPDPLAAWDAINTGRHFEVLITRVEFPPGRSNGVALARMARARQPGIRVVFAALPRYASDAADLGTFLPMPVTVPAVVAAVRRLLEDLGRF